MDIPAIDQVLVHTNQLNVITPVDTNASITLSQTAAIQATNTASVVQFSTLAQLLAATALFQANQQTAQGSVTTPDFNQLASATNQFVSAFNNFQNNITDKLVTPFESAFDNALLLAMHTNNDQSDTNMTQSVIDSLSEIGIQFQEASNTLNPNQFQINWANLEEIYTANPGQTTDLLLNAFQALASIEQNLISTDTNLTTPQTATVVATGNIITAENYSATTLAVSNTEAATTAPAATTTLSTTPAAVIANAQLPKQALMTDTLIAVEIAAYRLNESIGNTLKDTHPNPVPEVDKDIAQIPGIEAITFNAHEGAGANENNKSPRNENRHTWGVNVSTKNH